MIRFKNFFNSAKELNWLRILLFYAIILVGTYFARQQPNLLRELLLRVTDIPFSFNYNHGIVTLVVSLIFYKFSGVNKGITLLGNNKSKSLLFPLVLFTCYTFYGMGNSYGIDKHVWAFIFCTSAFIYNLMEEYAWRGYLIDSLGKASFVFKSILSGVFWCLWHLLIFSDFDQYGGFWNFFAFCIVFSFILTFASIRTESLIVVASIHAFIIQINVAAIICFVIFIAMLLMWNRRFFGRPEGSATD